MIIVCIQFNTRKSPEEMALYSRSVIIVSGWVKELRKGI